MNLPHSPDIHVQYEIKTMKKSNLFQQKTGENLSFVPSCMLHFRVCD